MKPFNLPSIAMLVSLAAVALPSAASAATLNIGFTKLTGITGGSPAGTAVYRADLSGLGFDLNSLLIQDNSSGLGGSPGAFSGFDLDGIKLSTSFITNAADVNAIPGLSVFDFSPAGTLFTPGVQRPPADPALFGTTGGNLDDAIATLASFDANSTTGLGAGGFVSLGDNGSIGFNLTSSVASTSPLYLYIGEVGDNGEVAAGQITVSDGRIDQPQDVPEPASWIGLAIAGLAATALRRGSDRQVQS